MELLVVIVVFLALDVLALRFGHDSRDLGLRSSEHRLADLGFGWSGRPGR
jgi:hypothetical protein